MRWRIKIPSIFFILYLIGITVLYSYFDLGEAIFYLAPFSLIIPFTESTGVIAIFILSGVMWAYAIYLLGLFIEEMYKENA